MKTDHMSHLWHIILLNSFHPDSPSAVSPGSSTVDVQFVSKDITVTWLNGYRPVIQTMIRLYIVLMQLAVKPGFKHSVFTVADTETLITLTVHH